MIRVTLPFHLRTIAQVAGEVVVCVEGPVTQRSVLDARELAEVRRQDDADHRKVCTWTDSTAGRSRTIGCHRSPASGDA